ncbi:MAG: nucleotidyltransferase domain-containing protein [Acidobacteria bacterium]|nr:nucleotidyltransferase domain-containing protein [Acidobacteriota bacterium]
MYTERERRMIRESLLARGQADTRLSGGAVTGSAAADREDTWSDIDLAFGVAGDLAPVLAGWTAHMYEVHGAIHHMDIQAGSWIYRVFLLANGLQVDLAFVPAADFRPLAPAFRLVFGEAGEAVDAPAAQPQGLIDFAWLYALHVRSAVARGHYWQAEYMISALRDNVISLACLRLGLPSAYGKGAHGLPVDITDGLRGALVTRLDAEELARAYGVAVAAYLREVALVDAGLAARLEPVLTAACETS